METVLTKDQLDDQYASGELSEEEYDRLLAQLQDNCPHANIEMDFMDMGDDGISGYMSYVIYECSECGKSSRNEDELRAN